MIGATATAAEVGRFIPKGATISYLTDALTGILRGNYDLDETREERLKGKFDL